MASTMAVMVMVVLNVAGVSVGVVYRVGDSAGWTSVGHPDYNHWASSNKFQVGDTLLFSYHRQYHDVMEVSHHDYTVCNSNSPKASFHSGSDFVTLAYPGDVYFICSNDGHCSAGQKLHVRVHNRTLPSLLAGPPRPSPSSSSSPLLSRISTPGPNVGFNNAAILGPSRPAVAAILVVAFCTLSP